MFDPFKDFDTAGYLRNLDGEKDLAIVKMAEHQLFRVKLPEAADFLTRQTNLSYRDFLQIHHILFHGLYPWAGQDRATTTPDSLISKGSTFFAHPLDAERAINEGLRLGRDSKTMRARPGEIMGLFAYGHPFLDGNGRAMLLIHTELCQRAGFSILWQHTHKSDYLLALTNEITSPGKGILDRYLLQFIGLPQASREWISTVAALPGLAGSGVQDELGSDSDPSVIAQYQQFERERCYDIKK